MFPLEEISLAPSVGFPASASFPVMMEKTGNRFIQTCGTEMKARRKEGMGWTGASHDEGKGGGEHYVCRQLLQRWWRGNVA